MALLMCYSSLAKQTSSLLSSDSIATPKENNLYKIV
jgi:hypothetical protein